MSRKLLMIPVRIREALLQIQSLDKVIKRCVVLLIVGHFLTEMSSIFSDIWPDLMSEERYWFWSPAYHKKWEIKWFIKNSCDDLLWVIVCYCFTMVAKKYSTYLFLVGFIFFCYHVMDFFMFWWDFKSSHYMYWDLLLTAIIMIRGVFKGYKPETLARIKSIF